MNFLFSKKYVNMKLSFAQGIKKRFFSHSFGLFGFYFVTPPVGPEPLELREF
jgi:hypothetical protein